MSTEVSSAKNESMSSPERTHRRKAHKAKKSEKKEERNNNKLYDSSNKIFEFTPVIYPSSFAVAGCSKSGYAGSTTVGNLYVGSSKEGQYSDAITKYAKQYNLDPNIVAAVINTESTWNKNAVSSADCKGLMQLNPKYFSGDLNDTENNISQGCKYLRQCMDAYDSVDQALVAYNQGIAGAKNTPSSKYSQKVLAEYNKRTELAENNSGTGNKLYCEA